ncbi:zinc metallopeptidase [Tianweitania sp. BSSL-BM11]|uniref:Zinc metallopeptidase n=1 Tax=Tianweitania aestuarii TaxID=2814886 RepID=A0ABS5RXF5_9HYPH|nr:neutral zinc metallopeptidase [Tianweitania aestuarii]MBS9720992.1 zinc metallopeptidase [Tianweitania aestuarii]
MQWRGRRQSSNVEDRRGGGGGGFGGGGRIPIRGAGGGLGIGGIIILLIGAWIFGINPLELLSGGGSMGGGGQTQTRTADTTSSDEMTQFVSTVLAETEDTWNGIFQAEGETYKEPRMVLFSNQVRSACGTASSASGPFYCPNDERVYLDTTFFQELDQKFGASGDFAQAYVIAHEVGHHVQNLTGILPRFNQMRQTMSPEEANRMSVRVELQADCFAGVWAHYTQQKGLLDAGDVDEALNAATQIGDDTLQKRTQGYVVPDSFNHGTSAQRRNWFQRGIENGRLSDCDTFNNPV